MQQAYRALRVVAEAQTIRIVLTLTPTTIMLRELCTACAALKTENSNGVKAIVLDFKPMTATSVPANETIAQDDLDQACAAVHRVEAPVLAVVRGTLSDAASALVHTADLTLVANDAVLTIRNMGNIAGYPGGHNGHLSSIHETLTGMQALRLGYTTWSVPMQHIDSEMERILAMLREKSALALRLTKASVRLGASATQSKDEQAGQAPSRLEALKQINEFYLTQVIQTADATEGLHAFLEKRKPQWKNR